MEDAQKLETFDLLLIAFQSACTAVERAESATHGTARSRRCREEAATRNLNRSREELRDAYRTALRGQS